jgi:tetratricopeptide (TPR) repeat protein
LRLDQLSDRDLAVMNSLMAYWDTLGWVYFAKGDLDKAEKYVLASSRLDPRSDAADHLGQIYEKLGKKDDAIRAYAMALSGIRPDPETRGRLAKLLGGDNRVDAAIREFGHDLSETSHLSLTAAPASADYFLLFGPNGTIEDAKFVGGDDKLKAISDALRATKYSVVFPDDNPGRILRRGKVTCGADSSQTPALTPVHGSKDGKPATEMPQGCSITFAGISDVHSVN